MPITCSDCSAVFLVLQESNCNEIIQKICVCLLRKWTAEEDKFLLEIVEAETDDAINWNQGNVVSQANLTKLASSRWFVCALRCLFPLCFVL